MKRSLKYILLLFILTSPLLSLGQLWVEEEKGELIELNNKHTKNKRIISISEFVEDLKLAAEQKKDYLLENYAIIYKEKEDRKYVQKIDIIIESDAEIAVINDNISFIKGSSVTLSNCSFVLPFGFYALEIRNMNFWNLNLTNLAFAKEFDLDSIKVHGKLDIKYNKETDYINYSNIGIQNSNINSINVRIADSLLSKKESLGFRKLESSNIKPHITTLYINNNRISNCEISNVESVRINENHIAYLNLSGKIESILIKDNQFYIDFRNALMIRQISEYSIFMTINSGLDVYSSEIGKLNALNNNSLIIENLTNDSIISIIKRIKDSINGKISNVISFNEKYLFNKITENKHFELLDQNIIITKEQLEILEKLNQENDSLRITHTTCPMFEIRNSEFEILKLNNDTVPIFNITNNNIKDELSLYGLSIDSSFLFYKNKLPLVERINIDKTSFDNLSFSYNKKSYYGNEDYSKIKDIYKKNQYLSALDNLIMTHRQFINILDTQGKGAKKIGILKLKDLETTKKMYDYYNDTKTENWFNWKGSIFLKWYSDHGTNPFKALSYCFWVVIYFSLFYFIFYNDWDKIDRKFLIKRFNSAMDYFTTEKRIEDFYSTTHDKEMTTFTEFKETLDKNKVHMPSMLNSLAKPIYQISLFRYKLLSFFYKKAEFMAGRKWLDLKKKDRYLIGTLTFFLTISYIIYLISIRALNSLTLSINAFSTLGFGQIPVRGFTKYVAIIEGFIGWFLLSIFLVSILNQMMSV